MVDRLLAGDEALAAALQQGSADGGIHHPRSSRRTAPDGGHNNSGGDHSYQCPACGADNFKVNLTTGKWWNWNCDCTKAEIRNAISPAVKPSATKQTRTKQSRSWDSATAKTLEHNQPALTVHRTDDGNGKRSSGKSRSMVTVLQKSRTLPAGLSEAKQALADGTPYIFWVEGESCVDALRALGLFLSHQSVEWQVQARTRCRSHPPDRLVVVPDRDKPGIAHAEAVAAAHPGCQWLFPFPGTAEWNGKMPTNHGLDIADWIQQARPLNTSSTALAASRSGAESGAMGDKLSEWEQLLAALVNPSHPLFERNTIRRQIRAATAAAEAVAGLS